MCLVALAVIVLLGFLLVTVHLETVWFFEKNVNYRSSEDRLRQTMKYLKLQLVCNTYRCEEHTSIAFFLLRESISNLLLKFRITFVPNRFLECISDA